jgi:hypothetical protein
MMIFSYLCIAGVSKQTLLFFPLFYFLQFGLMKFLFITFLLFVLFVFLFGFSVLRMLFNGLFGTKPKSGNHAQNQQRANQDRQPQPKKAKKIIEPDEGEYVDFEEIKD